MILSENINRKEHHGLKSAMLDIASAVRSTDKVSGRTHLHYKYPAGFSPEFPRAVIRAFSKPGDWVLDPFVGGGTSAIEALHLGRNIIGIDANELAIFSSRLKTLQLSTMAIEELEEWRSKFENIVRNIKKLEIKLDLESGKYFDLVPRQLAQAIYYLHSEIAKLRFESSRTFARGVLLRVSQLILDGRNIKPEFISFTKKLEDYYDSMLEQTLSFSNDIRKFKPLSAQLTCADGRNETEFLKAFKKTDRINVVLTSPPYPAVHILYNRWQIGGRKESMLPYYIIGSEQKLVPSFFTMGNRNSQKGIETYFQSIYSVYKNVSQVVDRSTPVIQLVAFNNRKEQLEPFLQSLSDAGFIEYRAWDVAKSQDGRIWRNVPNRRWYNSIGNGKSHSSNEVVLIHRKK